MRNVIVTGGSRGLGLGIALKLREAGYGVIAIARQQSGELKVAIAEAEGSKAGALRFVPFDLADIDGIPAMVRSLR